LGLRGRHGLSRTSRGSRHSGLGFTVFWLFMAESSFVPALVGVLPIPLNLATVGPDAAH